MPRVVTTGRALALLTLCCAGCNCEPNHLPASLNTVDPSKHEPYQPREPNTTGNPTSSTGPQDRGPDDDARHPHEDAPPEGAHVGPPD